MEKIKFYCPKENYHGLKTDPEQVFLVIPNTEKDCSEGCIMTYAPIGQHSEAFIDYIENDCREITKEEFLKITDGIYTPAEYLKDGINYDDIHELEVRLASNVEFLKWISQNYGDLTLRRSKEELENGEPANLSAIIEDLEDIGGELQNLELIVINK